MTKVVVFRKSEKTPEEIASRMEQYLSQAWEALRPFDGVATCVWNSHRNKITIRGNKFHADVVIVPKGIVVRAEIPMIWYPFRKKIEERIFHALDMIIGKQEEGRDESCF